ncbi:MAG: hypothetical protein RL120_06880, partial [Gammaproteobacteria bacterium]
MIVQNLLALMGLVFMAGGWFVYLVTQNRHSSLFVVYCCLTAVHWAGPPTLAPGLIDDFLLGLFIIFGSALMESVFLHLALEFSTSPLPKWLLALVYLPPLAGILLLAMVSLSSLEIDLLLPVYMVGMAWGIAAGLTWLFRLVTNRIPRFPLSQRALIAASLVLAWLPNTLANSGLFGESAYWGLTNMSMLLLLAGISWLLIRRPVL